MAVALTVAFFVFTGVFMVIFAVMAAVLLRSGAVSVRTVHEGQKTPPGTED
ncbi:hypothetical protein [Austwickia sp. TVS 96-490-7B]|uniref:hypothetical protein n=1 Tax=Austwickia sp. TVS 96-490-7B TaxID=2830843 RepID=UPI001C58145C|nr:hypothetical protein [Austwickia sp. TVS 96-490-7B]